jgi:hypothetical protein
VGKHQYRVNQDQQSDSNTKHTELSGSDYAGTVMGRDVAFPGIVADDKRRDGQDHRGQLNGTGVIRDQ